MSDARSGRLGVGLIGAGRVGPVLAAALAGAGHAVTGVTATSDDAKDRVEALVPGVPIIEPDEVIRRSELVILAVPTDQLEGLVTGLAARDAWQPGQIVLHTAAEFGTGVLQPAQARGAIPLAVHPMLTFTGTSLDITRLTESYFAVTAPAPVQPIGQALVVEMGAEPVIVAESDRPAYADAVGTARDFSASIVRQATDRLASIGVERPGRVLGALVRSAVDEALRTASDEPGQVLPPE